MLVSDVSSFDTFSPKFFDVLSFDHAHGQQRTFTRMHAAVMPTFTQLVRQHFSQRDGGGSLGGSPVYFPTALPAWLSWSTTLWHLGTGTESFTLFDNLAPSTAD